MTQREINRMDQRGRNRALLNAAEKLDRKLNLYGTDDEPINGLLDPEASIGTIEARLDKILEPECDHRRGACGHGFPAWFCAEAQPVANEFLRVLRQVRKAEQANA